MQQEVCLNVVNVTTRWPRLQDILPIIDDVMVRMLPCGFMYIQPTAMIDVPPHTGGLRNATVAAESVHLVTLIKYKQYGTESDTRLKLSAFAAFMWLNNFQHVATAVPLWQPQQQPRPTELLNRMPSRMPLIGMTS